MKECTNCHRCLEDDYPVCPDDAAPVELIFEGTCTLDARYRLIRRLGKGAMGRVYLARHLTLNRTAAIKVLAASSRSFDPVLVERFEREAEALGRLRHPAIVEVLDFGVEAARSIPYLVMEHLEGAALAEKLRSAGALDVDSALALFDAVAAALDHAHAAGVLHRDLKPSNVFLVEEGELPPRGKVVDFGLAQLFYDTEETVVALTDPAEGPVCPRPGELTQPGAWLGTPGYIAPEVLRGEPATPAADIYGFGALIYATLVGHPPFRGTAAQVAVEPLERCPIPPSLVRQELGAELDAPVLAALDKDPAARPPTARSVAGRLQAARRRSRWWRAAPVRLACAVFLGLAAAVGTSVLQRPLAGIENRLVDLRFHLGPRQAPRHPLLLVLIDESTLEADPTPLTDQADEIGHLLARTLEQGALGVGIDLLLPDVWSRSAPFSDLVLRHRERLVLAAFSSPDGTPIGTGAVSGLTAAALGPERTRELFGYANLHRDPDSVVRRARIRHRDVSGRLAPSLAFKLAQTVLSETPPPWPEGELWIDFTLDWQQIETIAWKDLGRILDDNPERLRGRLVLVGATYTGSGDGPHRVPHPRGLPAEMPGPMIQAVTVHTLLDAVPVRPANRLPVLGAVGILAALVAGLALLAGKRAAVPACAVAALGWTVTGMVAFNSGGWLLPMAPALAGLLSITALATFLRRFSALKVRSG